MKKILVLVFFASLLNWSDALAQKLEFMAGDKELFADVQWLRPFDKDYKWTLFSRSRATVDYENRSNLFTGAYFNYTTRIGIGGTIVGRISTLSSGGDIGVHYLKSKEKLLVYALSTTEISEKLSLTWFSIIRFTPNITERFKLYTSLELYSNFNSKGHVASIQRIRIGLDKASYQFGFALNLSGYGESYNKIDSNIGLFVSKQF